MKFRVQFNVILGCGAVIDGWDMRGEISRALSSLVLP
jgi:hypothetical protein